MNIFMFDAETDGLYGPVWAIGAVVYSEGGSEIAQFSGQIDPQSVTNAWVREHVVPHVDLPLFESARALRNAFWAFWMAQREEATCWADFGAPVEAGLFRACVEDDPEARQWLGPYPLHEVGTMLLVASVDPDIDRVEFAGLTGLKKHDPLDDCRASFACWLKAQAIIEGRKT